MRRPALAHSAAPPNQVLIGGRVAADLQMVGCPLPRECRTSDGKQWVEVLTVVVVVGVD
jgi:hypothetical protein